jgi:hypothetical protein
MSVVDPTWARLGAGRSNAININAVLTELTFMLDSLRRKAFVPLQVLRVALT